MIEKVLLAVIRFASVTVTMNEYVPAVVGVPLKVLPEVNDSPGGPPLVMLQLRGDVPPLAESISE
jgi:hypothetical protein